MQSTKEQPINPTRILIIGPAWVGDMVMAQSLYLTLQQHKPNCQIDVVAPSWSLPLLQRMPQVRQAHELAVGHNQLGLYQRLKLAQTLRMQQYDQAIVLPRSLKAALLPWFARIPQRTGYRGEWRYGLINDMHDLDKTVLGKTVQRLVALAYPRAATLPPPIPAPQLTIDVANQQRLLTTLGLNTDKSIVGMMPGAEYGPAKQWPMGSYRALADQCSKAGKQVWLLGSAKEQDIGEQIAHDLPHVYNLCGKTRLHDAIDLLALTQVCVTNDSGLMHIACATGRPVVAIYGSSTPNYTPPLSEQATVVYHRLSCSPCFKRTCPLGHTQCLTGIGVDEVLQAVNKY